LVQQFIEDFNNIKKKTLNEEEYRKELDGRMKQVEKYSVEIETN